MKDFLFRKNLTVKKFAGDLGISPSYLYQLLRGERKPSLQLAHKIEKYTKGEVTVKKLLDHVLHKKNNFYKELDIQQELEVHERRLFELEACDENLKDRFESLERRLSRLEKEREL